MSSNNASADEGFYSPVFIENYPGAEAFATGDFNGDEFDDLVMLYGVLDGQPIGVPQFFLQNAGGAFVPIQEGAPAVQGNRVLTADFDDDGYTDILVTGGNLSGGLVYPSKTSIFFNSGNWGPNGFDGVGFTFFFPYDLGGLHYAPEAVVGDIDNDNDVDVVLGVSESGGLGTIEIWINQGNAQGGSLGAFQKINYAEDSGPYNTITALSLAQVSESNAALDLIFARQGINQVSIALNDGNGGFATSPVTLPVSGDVKDIQMVADDYIAVALYGAASPVFSISRNGDGTPTDYPLFRTIGTSIQQSEKIIPTEVSNKPAFFLSSDFDGEIGTEIANLKLYEFDFLGPTPLLKASDQCLLVGDKTAKSAASYAGDGTNALDLSLLTKGGDWFIVFNNQSPFFNICCMTETQFVAVNDVAVEASQLKDSSLNNGLDQVMTWLDSFQKLKDIRNLIMPITVASQRYEDNYAQHEGQLLTLMAENNGLAAAWTDVLTSWNVPLTAILDGTDADVVLTGQQMAHVATFLGLLQNEPGVGATISNELALIQPLNSYAGGGLQVFTMDTLNLVSPVIFKDSFE